MAERLNFRGRVVLITGGGQGIGAELVKETLARGGTPIVVEYNPKLETGARARIGARGAVHLADVRDAAAMERVVADTVAAYGRLDVVIANAGVEAFGPVWAMPAEEFEAVIEINVLGAYRSIKPALPHVIAAKGHVLTISSIAGLVTQPIGAAYSTSKAAVDMMMRIFRMDLLGTGASASAAYFGVIPTQMGNEVNAHPVLAAAQKLLPTRLLGVTPPPTAAEAAKKIMDGVERRKARIYAPWMVRVTYLLRGFYAQADDFQARSLMGLPKLIRQHYGAPPPPESAAAEPAGAEQERSKPPVS